jgi:molybdopterin biosynthesis enzyme
MSYTRQTASNLARHEMFSAARRFVVEKDAVAGIHAVGFAVVDGYPVRVKFGGRIRAAGIKRRCLVLRRSLRQSVQFGSGRLVKAGLLFQSKEPDLLEAAFREACENADAVITSGGVSVGAADYTRQIMDRLGDMTFWQIGMRPGRPMAFGKINSGGKSAYLFGLPGNPVAVMVTFYFFVRDALLRMMGANPSPLPLMRVASQSAIRKKSGRTEYQRGILSQDAENRWQVRITGSQGSGILRSMSEANCMVILHHEQGNVQAGEQVDVAVFEGLV